MEVLPYDTTVHDEFINNIVMIPEKDYLTNGFYKIIKSSGDFFYVRKINCETKLIDDNQAKKKIYQAIILDGFENNVLRKIKKTSIHKKYPVIIASVVQYEKKG